MVTADKENKISTEHCALCTTALGSWLARFALFCYAKITFNISMPLMSQWFGYPCVEDIPGTLNTESVTYNRLGQVKSSQANTLEGDTHLRRKGKKTALQKSQVVYPILNLTLHMQQHTSLEVTVSKKIMLYSEFGTQTSEVRSRKSQVRCPKFTLRSRS